MFAAALSVCYCNSVGIAVFAAALYVCYCNSVGIAVFAAALAVRYRDIIAALFVTALVVCYCNNLPNLKGEVDSSVFRCGIFRRIGRFVGTACSLVKQGRDVDVDIIFLVALLDIIKQRRKIAIFVLAFIFVEQIVQVIRIIVITAVIAAAVSSAGSVVRRC